MGYLVLARKWRPQQFDDVVGQEHVTTTLRNAIAQQRIAHAFLFSGPRGVGKTTVARLLAKALNCAQGPTGTPCGTCASCEEITGGRALDVIEIDGASNTGVDNVRDLNENTRYRPAAARFKVYIIDEVHMLSTAAFNALLKTLEEPPEHIKFIFATTEVQKLPPTVVSRCQRYEFKRIAIAETMARLRAIATDEKLKIDDAALFALAREADGSMRDAQSLLDQVIVFAGKSITEDDVRGALGIADRAVLHRMTEAILGGDAPACLRGVDELHGYGYEVQKFCLDLVRQFRNLTVAALFDDRDLLNDLPDDEVTETQRQATLRPARDLQRLFRLAQEAAEEVRRSQLPTLVLEMAVVKMATMPDATPVGDIVARLEEMERRLRSGGGSASGGSMPTRSVDSPVRPTSPSARGRSAASEAAPAVPTVPAADQPASPLPGRGEAPSGTGGGSGSWAAFLVAIQESIGLRLYLAGSRLVEQSATLLHIGVENEFAVRGLQDQDNLATLQAVATRCYGAEVRVKVSVVQRSEVEIAAVATAESARRRALSDQAQASPAVRAAVEILGGEVTKVRPRVRGGTNG